MGANYVKWNLEMTVVRAFILNTSCIRMYHVAEVYMDSAVLTKVSESGQKSKYMPPRGMWRNFSTGFFALGEFLCLVSHRLCVSFLHRGGWTRN